MFLYRLVSATGGDEGQVELAIPTIRPWETVMAGDGRCFIVLDVVDDLPDDSQFRAILTVEPLTQPKPP